jgi:hypothetical protein
MLLRGEVQPGQTVRASADAEKMTFATHEEAADAATV